MTYELEGVDVLVVSIVVWFVGTWITGKIRFLKAYSIPPAVTGGMLCSLLVAALFLVGGPEVSFDMRLRDLCLLVFFSTIGLSAKLSMLKSGGKALVVMLAAASGFLILQNLTGIFLMKSLGQNPVLGLFGGSISFAGGHGTAIAWGQIATEAGLTGAAEIGIACATFGLIAGGLIGGPLAERLITKHKLSPAATADEQPDSGGEVSTRPAPTVPTTLQAIFLLGICLGAGDGVNRHLAGQGVMLPGFLTAMIIGIVITNLADVWKLEVPDQEISRQGDLCLQLFLSMSLMSMQLWTLAGAMGPILLTLIAQILVVVLFTTRVVFPLMGRDYDAAVISGGFAGLGMGATPVGIANMQAVTAKYGASAKAFLVIPLIGAFFIDLVNAVVIKAFAASPLLQQAAP